MYLQDIDLKQTDRFRIPLSSNFLVWHILDDSQLWKDPRNMTLFQSKSLSHHKVRPFHYPDTSGLYPDKLRLSHPDNLWFLIQNILLTSLKCYEGTYSSRNVLDNFNTRMDKSETTLIQKYVFSLSGYYPDNQKVYPDTIRINLKLYPDTSGWYPDNEKVCIKFSCKPLQSLFIRWQQCFMYFFKKVSRKMFRST